jgi:hypothetical protein
MAKHKAKRRRTVGKTTVNRPWDELKPAERAAEFDKSHANPWTYALANFRRSNAVLFVTQRAAQVKQQTTRRENP